MHRTLRFSCSTSLHLASSQKKKFLYPRCKCNAFFSSSFSLLSSFNEKVDLDRAVVGCCLMLALWALLILCCCGLCYFCFYCWHWYALTVVGITWACIKLIVLEIALSHNMLLLMCRFNARWQWLINSWGIFFLPFLISFFASFSSLNKYYINLYNPTLYSATSTLKFDSDER